MSYIGNEPIVSATRTVTEVTATAGQTVFTANGGYTVGYLDVFINGSKLTSADFTATNGTTVTLTEAAQVSDIVRLEALGTFQAANAVLLTGNSNLTGNLNVSGNLGVGTTSPNTDAKLDVIGNITIDSAFTSTDYGLCFRRGFETNDNCRIYAGDTGVGREGGIRIAAFDGFSVGAGSNSWAEKFRISSNGSISNVIPGNSTLYPDFACRAWVTFNGQGTPSIFASGGVTSVVRTTTGTYKVNFSFTLPDRDHTGVVTADGNSVSNSTTVEWGNVDADHTTSSGSVRSSAGDFRRYSVAVFR